MVTYSDGRLRAVTADRETTCTLCWADMTALAGAIAVAVTVAFAVAVAAADAGGKQPPLLLQRPPLLRLLPPARAPAPPHYPFPAHSPKTLAVRRAAAVAVTVAVAVAGAATVAGGEEPPLQFPRPLLLRVLPPAAASTLRHFPLLQTPRTRRRTQAQRSISDSRGRRRSCGRSRRQHALPHLAPATTSVPAPGPAPCCSSAPPLPCELPQKCGGDRRSRSRSDSCGRSRRGGHSRRGRGAPYSSSLVGSCSESCPLLQPLRHPIPLYFKTPSKLRRSQAQSQW